MAEEPPASPRPSATAAPAVESVWQRSAVQLAIFLACMRVLGFVEEMFPQFRPYVLLGRDLVTIGAGALGITYASRGRRRSG